MQFGLVDDDIRFVVERSNAKGAWYQGGYLSYAHEDDDLIDND